MPLRKKEVKKNDCNDSVAAEKITASLTQQLLGLKETFTKVHNAVCRTIEKDCGGTVSGDDSKAKELAQIKEKYSDLKEEVCRLISQFTLNKPITIEETTAVQEGLTQCMSYLCGVHNTMETMLKKYEVNDEKKCCDTEHPHIHKFVDGIHVIIKLNKGTRNEMDYVNRLISNVKTLPEEKRKKLFSKIFNVTELVNEHGGGDEMSTSAAALKRAQNISLKHEDSIVEETSQGSIFHSKFTQNVYSISNSRITIESRSNVALCPSAVPIDRGICKNKYFPEKMLESLVAGYSWGNCIQGAKSEFKIQNKTIENSTLCEKSKTIGAPAFTDLNTLKCNDIEQSSLLHIFDSKGNPLTDSKGVPLKNVNGELLVKFKNNAPICNLNGEQVFDKHCLPFVESLDKPLYDTNGEPLRLYNYEGIPLTDNKGYVLKLFNGKYAIVVDNKNRLVSDACGRPLYSFTSERITNPLPDSSSRQPSVPIISKQPESENVSPMLYNKKGFLLTDTDGKPLTDTQGKPLIIKDHASGAVMDNSGHAVYDTNGNVYNGPAVGKVLALYDCNKYPLTNSEGTVLRTVEGEEMVIFDKTGKPIKDCFNRVVHDSSGNPSNSTQFTPYRNPVKTEKSTKLKTEIEMYDFRGHPLLDSDFTPLTTSDGKPLIEFNSKGEYIHDLNGYPLYDKRGIPLTKINNCWTTPHGEPYRVYDSKGFPLTNENGEELLDIKANKLIKLDSEGRPVETVAGTPVYDVSGFQPTHPDFSPGQRPAKSAFTRKVYMYNRPMKVYNQYGIPLTDHLGTAMLDAKGRELIQFDEYGIPIKDLFGDRIFDEFKVPLNCHKDESIISMNGKPFRIYDKQGRPLTDINGIPLNLANGLCTIKFDNAGRPVSDFRNADLFDFEGRSLLDPQANAEFFIEKDPVKLIKRDGTPVQVYNREGMPLTDKNGIMLINSDGSHLRLNNDKYPVAGCNGEPVYNEMGQPLMKHFNNPAHDIQECSKDIFGRAMKDSRGEPQFDSYGRPLYDLYRRKLYDEEGRPIANAYGRYLTNNFPEPKQVDLGFDPATTLNARANPTTASLTDLIGGPLFDCLGMPLYNQYGKPVVDIYGRPLYDNDGLPLCDTSGKPVSELVRQNGVPVEVKDVYKLIEVNKEVTEMIDTSVIRSTRTEIRSTTSGIWILPSNMNNDSTSTGFNANSEKKLYWALLRMTTFSDGRKSFEILEAKPHTADS